MLREEDKEATMAAPDPRAAFAEAAAKIDPSHLAASLAKLAVSALQCYIHSHLNPSFITHGSKFSVILFAVRKYAFMPWPRLLAFLDCFGSLFSGVSLRWDDIFKEPVWSKLFHDVIDVSHIPEPVYSVSIEWINQHLPDRLLCEFVLQIFRYILKSTWKECCECEKVERIWIERERIRVEKPFWNKYTNVSILVAAAMVLRSKPKILTLRWGDLMSMQLLYEGVGALTTPLAVWMIAKVSQVDLRAGLKSWAFFLLPRVPHGNDQSKDLILKLVENILKKPDARTLLLYSYYLIPPPSFEILLRHTFPDSSAREEATTRRFAGIYPFLKDVALAAAFREKVALHSELFALSLRLAKEGNHDLAKEATEIAIWSLTKHDYCWEYWGRICKEYLETSVALLKRLVEKWKDHSLELSLLSSSDIVTLTKQLLKRNKRKKASFTGGPPTRDEEAIQEVKIQLEAMEQEVKVEMGQDALTKQLLKRNRRKRNKKMKQTGRPPTRDDEEAIQEVKIQLEAMEQEVKVKMEQDALTKQLLKRNRRKRNKRKRQTGGPPTRDEEAIQEVKIQQEAMEQEVKVEMDKIFTQMIFRISLILLKEIKIEQEWKIFEEKRGQGVKMEMEQDAKMQQEVTFSLTLAGEGISSKTTPPGYHILSKEATEIAVWSLTENIVWWKLMEYIYDVDVDSSVDILKMLVEKWKDHSLKLSSWSLNHTLSRAPDSKAMKQVTQKIFTKKIFSLSLRLAGHGYPDITKEATEIAIWSLTENVNCWKYWDSLYKKNLEASVALLNKLVEKWKDRSFKLSSSSSSDTLGDAPNSEAMKQAIQTVKSFRLKNKKAITEGGHVDYLYKEADELCKVISRGRSSLEGSWIAAVLVLVPLGLSMSERVFGYDK